MFINLMVSDKSSIMSALNEADFGSDTDDDDYVPEGEQHEASEEENSGDDENNDTESNAKGKKEKEGKENCQGLLK